MLSNKIYHMSSFEDSSGFLARGNISISNGLCSVIFNGEEDAYILSYKLLKRQTASGLSVKIRLSGWKSISYIAIGYAGKSGFNHIKAKNIRQDAWVKIDFTHEDLIWKLQNGFQNIGSADIENIRIFIKGEPLGDGAKLELEELSILSSRKEFKLIPKDLISKDLLKLIYDYLEGSFRDYTDVSLRFINTGNCPMPGGQTLKWDLNNSRPERLSEINTNRFAWHGLHLATNLLLYAEKTGDLSPVFSARNIIDNWLESSFFSPDDDVKFTWYDHGTAERLFSLIIMWGKGIELNFDFRFMGRLFIAIDQHARLLNSEAFYAYDQRLRYHNHAWFQDAALIAVSLAFKTHPDAKDWLENAINRFEDQLSNLIVRDGGFAIFVENSIGYHHGVQRLATFIGQLVELSGVETEIPLVAKELIAWSDFLRYPDGRAPAQGDTFRLPPRTGKEVRRGKPWEKPSCTVLPKAGYAVVKGNHEGKPWMLCLFNTSLSSTHKHEDNCSITLWFDGVEWLVDPSFYSHEYSQELPRRLRSAESHNSPRLKGHNYLIEQGRGFISFQCEGERFNIEAKHSFYDGVVVMRSIKGSLSEAVFIVEDRVDKESAESLRSLFLFPENASIRKEGAEFKVFSSDSDYELVFSSDLTPLSSEKPSAFGFMQSSQVSSLEYSGELEGSIRTEIGLKRKEGKDGGKRKARVGVIGGCTDKSIGNVLLIGSCVTRDALSNIKTDSIDYYARTSLISLASSPVSLPDIDKLDSIGNFERRMILSDFDKRLVSNLVPGRYDAVLLDLIDERFDLAMIGDSCVTYSNYLIQSGLLNGFDGLRIGKRFTLNDDWAIACKKIFEKLKLLNVPIILHKAWWAEKFYNHTTGEIEVFDEEQLKVVRKYNELLAFYYDTILRLHPQVIVVEVEPDLLYSDFAHKWGRDYFHYSSSYYTSLANAIYRVFR